MAGTRRKGKDPLPSPAAGVGTATLAPPRPASPIARPIAPARSRLPRLPDLSRRTAAGLLAAALAVAAVTGIVLTRGGDSASGSAAPRRVVLVTLDGADNAALGGVLLVSGGQGSAGGVLIPPRLLVDVAGFGSVTFAESGRAPQSGAQAAALGDALGITVAGTWRLGADAAARLIDGAGGLTVTVDSELLGQDAQGRSVVLLPAGEQRLDGAAALQYLSPLTPAEPEEAVAARLQQVLAVLLTALPAEPTQIAGAVTSLGASSRTDLAPADLAQTLAGVRATESPLFQTIPLRPLDSGGETPSYTLDNDRAAGLAAGLFAEVALPAAAAGDVRVLVQNGVGTPGLGQSARQRLVDAGLTYLNGGNAPRFGNQPSVVLIADGGTAARAQGSSVATALGLAPSSVQIAGQGQNLADVIVILGPDFAG
jgi:LytR cell envelope-related transcriptional attenuator